MFMIQTPAFAYTTNCSDMHINHGHTGRYSSRCAIRIRFQSSITKSAVLACQGQSCGRGRRRRRGRRMRRRRDPPPTWTHTTPRGMLQARLFLVRAKSKPWASLLLDIMDLYDFDFGRIVDAPFGGFRQCCPRGIACIKTIALIWFVATCIKCNHIGESHLALYYDGLVFLHLDSILNVFCIQAATGISPKSVMGETTCFVTISIVDCVYPNPQLAIGDSESFSLYFPSN